MPGSQQTCTHASFTHAFTRHPVPPLLQVFEQKVGSFIGTHGPKLQEAKRAQVAAHGHPDGAAERCGAARSASARRVRAAEGYTVEAARAVPDVVAQALGRRLPEDAMLQALVAKSGRRAQCAPPPLPPH